MTMAGTLTTPPARGPAESSGGQVDAQAVQESDRVAGPADRNGAHHQRVFEDQAPADHPGDDLAQHHVAVGVGAAGGGDHRRHLGVGQRGAGADRPGDQERDDHRRPGQARADPDQRVDAGADDGPDPERDQVRPVQRRLQPALVRPARNEFKRFPAAPGGHGVSPWPPGCYRDAARSDSAWRHSLNRLSSVNSCESNRFAAARTKSLSPSSVRYSTGDLPSMRAKQECAQKSGCAPVERGGIFPSDAVQIGALQGSETFKIGVENSGCHTHLSRR